MSTALDLIQQYMHDTLRPSDETIAAARGRRSDDQENVAGYSVLVIKSETNPDPSIVWYGDEIVEDLGTVFSSRSKVLSDCAKREFYGAPCTAYVVHWVTGDWSVFINPKGIV